MARVINGAGTASQTGLLLAAHGERRPDAGNEAAFRIARGLSGRGLVTEVAVGLIAGVPTIGDALRTLTAGRILVYPLFASGGYFTRDRLVQILDEANEDGRRIDMLPPLGLDPGLRDVVLDQGLHSARDHGFAPEACAVILLAHGSRRNPASREAAERVARDIERRAAFRQVTVAFLEESPSLCDVAAVIRGPAIVVGLFSGEGLHGARDAPRLVAQLRRADIVFAGVMGSAPGVERLVAQAVVAALQNSGPARVTDEPVHQTRLVPAPIRQAG
jgi:sirohydrochlorin ferrochelatase